VCSARPIISTLEVVFGVDGRSVASPTMSGFSSGLVKILIRVLINVVFVVMAVVFPGFDRIMAFLGSALCFTICVILPLMFYLKIFGSEVSMRERILDYVLVVISIVLATIGTAFTFIPKEKLGA
jgi:vesicular inhibitory amino acid transporter